MTSVPNAGVTTAPYSSATDWRGVGQALAFHAGGAVSSRQQMLFRFVSAPDFVNVDIGNTRRRAGKGWDPGDPNSLNSYWAAALRQILGSIQAEHPAFLLAAGDLVGGRWDRDSQHTGIFGPTGTVAQRLTTILTAGNFYYDAYLRWLDPYHLPFYPAIGDHDIGDNPWPVGSVKFQAIAEDKTTWAQHFTTLSGGSDRFAMHPSGPSAHTAYAFRFANTLFITVDEFQQTPSGVRLHLDPGQFTWLEQVLAQAHREAIQHIVVQGHLPVIGSNTPSIPSSHSSRLFFAAGPHSKFWQLLRQFHVDLYLAGEMHGVSRRDDGVVQIVHGAEVGYPPDTYLVADVYADHIVLTVKELPGRILGDTKLWQMSGKLPPGHIEYRPARTIKQWVIR